MTRLPALWIVVLLPLAAAIAIAGQSPPELVWQHKADIDGRLDSTQAVVEVGDLLVLAGQGGLQRELADPQRDEAVLVQGLRAATGEVLWSRRLDSASFVALRGGRDLVVLATRNSYFAVRRGRLERGGRLMALGAGSGETLWEELYRETDQRTTGLDLTFVELADGRLVYGGARRDPQGAYAPFLQARDAATGQLIWEHFEPLLPDSESAIFRAASARSRLCVAGFRSPTAAHRGFVAAWSMRSGARLWQVDTATPLAIAAQGRRCALVERLPTARRKNDRLRLALLHSRSGATLAELRLENRPRHALRGPRLIALKGSFVLTIDEPRNRFPQGYEARLFGIDSRQGTVRWQRQVELGRHHGVGKLAAGRGFALLQFTDGFSDDGGAVDRVVALAAGDGATLWTLAAPDAWLTGVAATRDGLILLPGRSRGPAPGSDLLLRALR